MFFWLHLENSNFGILATPRPTYSESRKICCLDNFDASGFPNGCRAASAVPSLPPPKDGSLRHAALACVQQLHSADLTLPSEHSKCQQTPPPSLSKCPLSLAPSSIPFHSKGFVQTFKLGKGRWSLLKEKHSGLQESARPMRAFLP